MPIPLIANRVARLLALGALLAACSSPPAGVVDLDGLAQNPLAGDAAAQVLVFVRSDCPIANRYAPELKRLAERFAGQRVALHLVYPDPDEAPATIRKHLDEYRLSDAKLGALRDPQHSLVSLAHAKVTPSAAVFVRGELAYSGRIDDTWVAFGKFRPQPTVRDLVDAVDAVLAGKAPAARETVAIGCYIPALQGEGE
ncbi:MAG: hypothetical protein R3F39_18920 [Myxococcota bacterium]